MKSKIAQSIIAGLVATAVMTGVGLMGPFMGLPKMNPAEMLSGYDGSTDNGWVSDALYDRSYFRCCVCTCLIKVHINSKFLKGIVFGFAVLFLLK
ncbi:MAG: hypothetical protein WKF59_18600 [Chitinophagaceae bacterium]